MAPPRRHLHCFLPHTEKNISELLERLRSALLKVSNPHLRALAECYLMDGDFMGCLCRAPAGVRVHHAYIGGLLEHLVTMMDVAERILPLYPDVDRDLVVLGVFLHDSGKVRELTYDRAFSYSDEGQLLGHLDIGIQRDTFPGRIQCHQPVKGAAVQQVPAELVCHKPTYRALAGASRAIDGQHGNPVARVGITHRR